jgi:hypothetical protein
MTCQYLLIQFCNIKKFEWPVDIRLVIWRWLELPSLGDQHLVWEYVTSKKWKKNAILY